MIALQSSIGLHFDLAELIIRILEKEPLRPPPDSENESGANRTGQRDLRDDHEDAAITMPGCLVRTHSDIEEMLLSAFGKKIL